MVAIAMSLGENITAPADGTVEPAAATENAPATAATAPVVEAKAPTPPVRYVMVASFSLQLKFINE